jgi:hypothetical protein
VEHKNQQKKMFTQKAAQRANEESFVKNKQQSVMKFVILSMIKTAFVDMYKDKNIEPCQDADVGANVSDLLSTVSGFDVVGLYSRTAVANKVPTHSTMQIFSDVLLARNKCFIENLTGVYKLSDEEKKYQKSLGELTM